MNGCVLAIDPGNELSAVVLVQVETYIPIMFAKLPNEDLMEMLDQQKGAGPDPGAAVQPDVGPSK